MNAIAIIPARRNSSRVPRKNKLLFNGKPGVLLAIEALQECKSVDRIVVASDDPEILTIGELHHVTTMHEPGHVAKSNDLYDVVDFVLRNTAETFDAVILAYPNVPIRPDGLFDLLCDTLNCEYVDAVAALCEDSHSGGGSIVDWQVMQAIIADRSVLGSYATCEIDYLRDEIVEIDTMEDVTWANTILVSRKTWQHGS